MRLLEEDDDGGGMDGGELMEHSDVAADEAAAATAGLHVDADIMLATAQEQLVAEQHDAVNAFHHHMKHPGGRHGGHGSAGIIWLLVLLHLAFIGYWGWVWWRQRKQRDTGSTRKPCAPQKVNCVYDWSTGPQLPLPLPNLQLAAKAAQH